MLPSTSTTKSDLHTSLLPKAAEGSGASETAEAAEIAEAFQGSEEKNSLSTPIPLVLLQKTQLQQLVVQPVSDSQTLLCSAPSVQSDFKRSKTASPKLQEFLQSLGVSEEELADSGVEIEVLDQTINKNLNGRILRWLALESWVVKSFQFPLLDERGIQSTEIVSATEGHCNQIKEWGSARVWPKATSVPFKSEAMLRHAYGVSEFFAGADIVITRVWSLFLLTFLGNDLYNYYAYPDERYDTTLTTILFTQSQNEQTLSNSLVSNYVWPEVLVIPVVWGLIKALRVQRNVRVFNETNRDDTIKNLLLFLEGYQPSLTKDVLLWFLPFNKIDNQLALVERTLLWDNRLSSEMRLALFTAFKDFSRRTHKLTQWHSIAVLNMLADGIAESDFLRMSRQNVDKATLTSFLTIRTESLAELQRLTSYQLNQRPGNGRYARYMKPFMRYLFAHYALWCLGQPRSKLLQPLFWSWKLGKLYVQFRFLYIIARGIATIIQRYLDKKACESQGKLWIYMDQVADYVCSVCGDLNVFYRNIFTMQSCINDFLSRPQPNFDEVMSLLQRIQPRDNITVLDFTHQHGYGYNEACRISEVLPKSQLTSLIFGLQNIFPSPIIHSIGDNGIACFAKVLPGSSLQVLDLRANNITNISTLMQALAHSSLQNLALNDNQIVDISSLVQALAHSALQSLDLSFNRIVDVSNLAQALPYSYLQDLDLGGNSIVDISSLAKALPHSSLQSLDLSDNPITDISSLAQALPYSYLQDLQLSWNKIVDISSLAQALPDSSLQQLDLSSNQIVDISSLIYMLPNSSLRYLDLSSNQIVNISCLAQALPHSSLQNLDLSFNRIVDVSNLAQALPHSSLQSLGLDNNQIVDISSLAKALPHSSLQSLDLSDNPITDISSLAQALPYSYLQDLQLSWNKIVDISSLAQALPDSSLQQLDLSSNQIVDISSLAQALPHSSLRYLGLIGNKIVKISCLAQALPHSSLQNLDLSFNRIVDVSDLAQALPDSSLQQLDLSSNQIVNISCLAQALPHSSLQNLDLSFNRIVDVSDLVQALPHSSLQNLALNENQIVNISSLAQTLPHSFLQYLCLAFNQIIDISSLAQALPHSSLQDLDLIGNPISSGVISFANALVVTPNVMHSLWVQNLDNNNKRALAHAEPNTNLQTLSLQNDNLNTSDAVALCRVFPYTKINPWIFTNDEWFSYKNNIDPNVVDIYTCAISAASTLETPFFIRWPYQTTVFFRQQLLNIYSTISYPFSTLARQNKPTITIEEVDDAAEVDTIESKLIIQNPNVSEVSRTGSSLLDFPTMLLQQAKSSASSLFNIFSRYIDNLIDSAKDYAAEVAADCPSYFPQGSPNYWRNGGSHTLLFSRATENTLSFNETHLLTYETTFSLLRLT